jgi:hypothetical protein
MSRLNIVRGFWRLWLAMSLVWVVVCIWSVYNEVSRRQEAEGKLAYARAELAQRRETPAIFPRSPAVAVARAGLEADVAKYEKERVRARAQIDRSLSWLWQLPLLSALLMAVALWVWSGFRAEG